MKTTTAIAVFAVIASGCGTDQAPLSQSEFTQRADAICAKAEERRVAGEAADAAVEMMADLHDLQPPKRIEGAFNDWIDALDSVVPAVIAVRDASSPAEKSAAAEQLSAASDRVYETQDALPLPQSCMS
jgi:hypothetical protein